MAGVVLKKDMGLNPENGKEGFDVWEADSTFGEFTYWNHDTLPSKSDHICSVMEWLPVSAAVSLLFVIHELISFSYRYFFGMKCKVFPCEDTGLLNSQ